MKNGKYEIQMQVNEWSCAAQEEGILRPGEINKRPSDLFKIGLPGRRLR